MGEWNSKEIDDPLEADPPTTRSTIRARSPRHPSNLLGFVRDVGALPRENEDLLRGEREVLARGDRRHCRLEPRGPHDGHDREEGRADDRLHSPDDRAGHDHNSLFVDAVRSGDVLLGP